MISEKQIIRIPKSVYMATRSNMTVQCNTYVLMDKDENILYFTRDEGYHANLQGNSSKELTERFLNMVDYPFEPHIEFMELFYELPDGHHQYRELWKQQHQQESEQTMNP